MDKVEGKETLNEEEPIHMHKTDEVQLAKAADHTALRKATAF